MTHTLPLACADEISELEAAGMADFELAGFTADEALVAGALGVAFAEGTGVLAAGVVAGAAAGVLDAVVSVAFLLFFDVFAVVAEVSLPDAGVLDAVVSDASFFFRDFFAVVAELSVFVALVDALLSSVAALSFFDFFDFFVVVVVVVSLLAWLLELACAGAKTGINARVNVNARKPIHRVNPRRRFIIWDPHNLRARCPYFTNRCARPAFSKSWAENRRNITSRAVTGQQKVQGPPVNGRPLRRSY